MFVSYQLFIIGPTTATTKTNTTVIVYKTTTIHNDKNISWDDINTRISANNISQNSTNVQSNITTDDILTMFGDFQDDEEEVYGHSSTTKINETSFLRVSDYASNNEKAKATTETRNTTKSIFKNKKNNSNNKDTTASSLVDSESYSTTMIIQKKVDELESLKIRYYVLYDDPQITFTPYKTKS